MNSDLSSSHNDEHTTAATPDLSHHGWQSRYDQGKTGWDRGEPNDILLAWLATGALAPCRVLIPGCGRGHEVIKLAQLGFEVTAVDFAPSAVAHVKEQLERQGLKATVVHSDIFEIEPSHRFDAIYEQTCLCALSPTNWERYEARLADWLQPQGKLFALFMQSGKTNEPPYSCEIDSMKRLFSTERWHWLTEPTPLMHPSGMQELATILQRFLP